MYNAHHIIGPVPTEEIHRIQFILTYGLETLSIKYVNTVIFYAL